MTETIVVGVDESEGAAEALRWAVREATVRGGRVLAVLAWGFLDQHHDPAAAFDPNYSEPDADAALARMISDAVPSADRDVIERRTICDLPARALLESARDHDMLVVGARGLGGFRGLLLGSVSQRCVHHATVPTVIVRVGQDHPHPAGVVVGIDGSHESEHALRWAVVETRLRDAPLTVVHGYRIPGMGTYPFSAMTEDPEVMPRIAGDVLRASLERVDTAGVSITPLTAPTGGAGAVLDAAKTAELVVVGSRGNSGFKRVLLGSVATEVALHARTPVAVIPPPEGPGLTGDHERDDTAPA